MKTIDQWLVEYGESHQNPINKKIHWVCVPIIMLSVVGLFASIPNTYLINLSGLHTLNWAYVVIALVLLYYYQLSLMMFVGMGVVGSLLLYICTLLDSFIMPLWKISIIIFIVGWVGQFYGHKIEGKKPSFFQDIQFLLIGPAWLLSFIYNKFGIKY